MFAEENSKEPNMDYMLYGYKDQIYNEKEQTELAKKILKMYSLKGKMSTWKCKQINEKPDAKWNKRCGFQSKPPLS